MRYQKEHVRTLGQEVHRRYQRLVDAFPVCGPGTTDTVKVDGPRVRMAVADLRAVLNEVNKLK